MGNLFHLFLMQVLLISSLLNVGTTELPSPMHPIRPATEEGLFCFSLPSVLLLNILLVNFGSGWELRLSSSCLGLRGMEEQLAPN